MFKSIVARSFQECVEELSLLRKLLESLGFFVINDATSQLRPVTRICLLSFIIDSVSMKHLLPKDKLEEILPRRRFLLLERQHMLLVFLCQDFQLFLQSFVVL